jgi:hypothetical protein
VDAAEAYFDDANQEFKKIQAQENLVQQLSKSNDWTAFYRNMRKVETDDEIKPVYRYRH